MREYPAQINLKTQSEQLSERFDLLADLAPERPTEVRAEFGEPFVRDFHLQEQRT